MTANAGFPRLETERLILRGPLESDYPAVAAFMASPRATFVGGPVNDEFATWRAFLAVIGHWSLRGYGFFTLEHRESGAIVGRAGIVNHIMWPEPELGWHLFDGFEGQGYAYEAAVEIRQWADKSLGLGPLISLIVPENERSVRLAERLGATAESEIELMGATGVVYRHPNLSAESAA
ncbi:GNAT family N-acetyltransferase [Thalassococcus lentus]|uniref:GNAT family N-acetyltransferase n=1 Tax=Thalassococcus lentus TaxID=1210524 RepID=A0ABT4XNU1_9RHOB|nr:GNAT family N-acetyltransferase [Thalassococcus lentus]MDA7423616.1 GNAT family N-acetyltransferase [Thalassococcus lentus]